MTDYTELIHRLRETESRSKRKLLDEAADVIERLAKDNESMLKTLKGFGCLFCGHHIFSQDHNPKWHCELELTAQQCHDTDAWEWRGVHE